MKLRPAIHELDSTVDVVMVQTKMKRSASSLRLSIRISPVKQHAMQAFLEGLPEVSESSVMA